ncbi:hypothetical protein ON010_g15509 [Phytophthora cinnamomi]|nr:hypothetical protein ON010_g15509 [Phytophthora cinnamomi]
MNLRAVAAAAFTALVGVDAAVIAHDAVVPFPQPTPNTTIQTVAVKFKPQIYINNGCHPYPAVDEDGNTSGGLKPTGSQSAGCKGSGYGSQIYGRAVEYEGVRTRPPPRLGKLRRVAQLARRPEHRGALGLVSQHLSVLLPP